MAAVLSRVFSSSPSKLSSIPADNDSLSSNPSGDRSASVVTSDPTENDTANNGQNHKMDTDDEDFVDEEQEEQDEQEEITVNGIVESKEMVSSPPTRRPDSSSRRKRIRVKTEVASDELEDDVISAGGTESKSASSEVPSYVDDMWEGTDDSGEFQPEIADRSRCIFCGEDEEHDPAEDFEEYLACSVCGDNAHRQCAREANSLVADEDAMKWRCPPCVERGAEPDATDFTMGQNASAAPKLTRDLLPAQKDDDPMDGSRSLRKRKPSDVSEKSLLESQKRQRRSQSVIVVDSAHQPAFRGRDFDAVFPTPNHLHPDTSPRSRSTRIKQNKVDKPLVSVIESSSSSLVLSFHCEPTKLANLENERRKRRRRERDRARRARQAERPVVEVSHYPGLQQSSFATPFFALNDREGDEIKSKPYGGILSEVEADTAKTFPQALDRKKFEDARQKAEEEWRRKLASANPIDLARPSQKVSGPPSKIKCINFGQHEIDTWHAAPYPEEYSRNRVLYICEFCLKYMNSDFVAWRHKLKCPARHPPGDEIYRDASFSFFEVDGRKNPVYCQNLCLLAKLFLGSKTLYYDVEPFIFYVMTENDDFGCHFVGYFSKEKRPSSQNNVSCILVLPIHQRRGFGHFLIDFSYLLTRVEKKTGSPEKPLSDMGLVSYRSYWRLILCYELLEQKGTLSISDISNRTGMTADDIICGLEGLRALVRDPVTKTYALRLDYPYFKQYIENYERKGYAKISPDALIWVPYVMGKENSQYEHGPQLHTVAQRDDNLDNAYPEEGVQMTANGISTKDYAKYGEETPLPASDMLTPMEKTAFEDDSPSTPIASKEHYINHPPNGTLEDEEKDQVSIPPTRFEVFPPLPGTILKKRAGRPHARTTSHRGTPIRRGLSFDEAPDTARSTTVSSRRPRSRLAETLDGADDDDDDDDEEEEAEGEGEEEAQNSKTLEAPEDDIVEQNGEELTVEDVDEEAADLENEESTAQLAE